jgi:hypothetical protein
VIYRKSLCVVYVNFSVEQVPSSGFTVIQNQFPRPRRGINQHQFTLRGGHERKHTMKKIHIYKEDLAILKRIASVKKSSVKKIIGSLLVSVRTKSQ